MLYAYDDLTTVYLHWSRPYTQSGVQNWTCSEPLAT